ncbi:MAG: methyltransferase domain-containing protein [Bacteroidetes bacterium]|nr:methyltransferase domain-containing protein [Bacteroidales bacterium]NJO68619.1 methyltransferase domain-containing protein [Bacteroidota bacterium]
MSLAGIHNVDEKHVIPECCVFSGEAVNFAQAQAGEVCVDIGCGSGADVFRMATEAGDMGFAFGVDTSGEMIQKAFKTAENSGITNVDFIHSEIKHIRLGSNLADLIISDCSINLDDNKKAVWAEIYRILKKGGRFVVSDFYITSNERGVIPDTQPHESCSGQTVSRGEYLQMLYDTGFVSVRILEESTPVNAARDNIVNFIVRGEKPGEVQSNRCRL